MNIFRPCRCNTAAISETKIRFEDIFEIGVFKGFKICLRGKSFTVLAMIISLFSLFDCLFLNFLRSFCSCFGWHCSIDLLVNKSTSKFLFHFFELYFRTCSAMFFCFVEQKMFRFTSFCRFFNVLHEILFDFSRLVSLFSHSAKK